MKVIVGLGNPGREYERTRHNVGFMVIDELIRRHAPGETGRSRFQSLVYEALIGAERVLLMKPMQYMNRSGNAVGEVLRFHKGDPSESLLVIVDDVALPLGEIRVRASGSAGTHNGLSDIQQKIGTAAYPRMRIGIDEPGMMDRVNYVLGRFTPEEESTVMETIKSAADAAACWVEEGVTTTMNRFNRRLGKEKPQTKRGSHARDNTPEDTRENESPGE